MLRATAFALVAVLLSTPALWTDDAKDAPKKDAAKKFLDHLMGEKSQATLRAKGFTEYKDRPEAPATKPSALRIGGEVPMPMEMTPKVWTSLERDSVKARDHDGQEHTFEGVTLERVLGAAGLQITSRDLRGPGLTRCLLVEAADGVSAARPGARRDVLESYVKRVKAMEDIARSFKGVEAAYAIQAGRELRIITKSDLVSDLDTYQLAKDVSKRIEAEMQYPGHIKVTVIREHRAVEYAR